MASVQIKVNGVLAPVTSITLGSVVTLTNGDDVGVTSWSWQFVDVPTGSTASLTTPTANTSTFVADKEGTYLVKLTINGITSGTGIAAVLHILSGVRLPAYQEKTEHTARGWTFSVNEALDRFGTETRSGRYVVGQTIGALAAGKVVRVTGTATLGNGQVIPTIAAADASSSSTLPGIGVVVDAAGGSGINVRVKIIGLLSEVSLDTSASSVGSPVYVSNTGDLSLTPGTNSQVIGYVATVSLTGRAFLAPGLTQDIPDASTSVSGKVNTSAQSFNGPKTFTGGLLTASAGLAVTGGATVSGDLTVDTNTLFVDSTNNRLGVGTTSPTETLDVRGIALIKGSSHIGMNIDAGNGFASFLNFLENGVERSNIYWDGANDRLVINDEGTNVAMNIAGGNLSVDTNTLFVDATNNRVGILTVSPTQPLEVAGIVYSNTGGFKFPDGSIQTTAVTSSAIVVKDESITITPSVTSIDFTGPGVTASAVGNAVTVNVTAGVTGTGISGAVAFWNGANSLTNDSSNLFWDDTNDRLGVLTPSPTQPLEVAGIIYSNSGGFKFPDGSIQTTASGAASTLTASVGWTPAASLAPGQYDSTTVTLTGAAVGTPTMAGFTTAPAGCQLFTEVLTADTVTVYLWNISTSTVNPTNGILTVTTGKPGATAIAGVTTGLVQVIKDLAPATVTKDNTTWATILSGNYNQIEANQNLIVRVQASLNQTGTDTLARFRIVYDGVATSDTIPVFLSETTEHHSWSGTFQLLGAATTGAKLVELQWQRDSGTGTLTIDSNDFMIMVVESPVSGEFSIQNEGAPIGQATVLNFVGSGVDATITGSVAEITVATSVAIQDEGVAQGDVNTINFTGNGVSASVVGNVTTVNITDTIPPPIPPRYVDIYELDLTALATNTFGSGDGIYSLGGTNWTIFGKTAGATTFQITNGTGLELERSGADIGILTSLKKLFPDITAPNIYRCRVWAEWASGSIDVPVNLAWVRMGLVMAENTSALGVYTGRRSGDDVDGPQEHWFTYAADPVFGNNGVTSNDLTDNIYQLQAHTWTEICGFSSSGTDFDDDTVLSFRGHPNGQTSPLADVDWTLKFDCITGSGAAGILKKIRVELYR